MSTQSRLNKDTVQLIKIATRVEFVKLKYDNGTYQDIALIYISDDARPILAMSGDRSWHVHDIVKAKRSIRRHNKTCLIIDIRDQPLIY